jgi:hypothetical protein
MIATVIRTGAGMVMVFDESGRQLPKFQGTYRVVRTDVLQGTSAGTVFEHWFGAAAAPVVVRAEEW